MRTFAMLAAVAALTACQKEPAPETNEAVPADGVAPTAPGPATTSEAAPRRSVFSPLDETACKLIEENKEEGPYWRRACPGSGGYSVEWTESDLRQGLEVVDPKGGKTSLDLSGKVANGAFNMVGPRIEWRGPAEGSPEALIVRVNSARQEGGADRSQLAVARLVPAPCLIGVIGIGPDQNARAAALADQGGACL